MVIVAVWSNLVAHKPVIKPKLPIKKDPKKSEAENETGTSAEQHVEGTKFVHTE